MASSSVLDLTDDTNDDADLVGVDRNDDIYIMMQCLFVTKNHHFLGSFMVFHGFWLVSMVF